MKSFKELEVYKLAYKTALEIFRLSSHFPKEEMYSLTTQIRDSTRSICSNIGEAWAKRRYPKHFASKLTDSSSESYETSIWLDFAHDHAYIDTDTHVRLIDIYDHVNAQLSRMIDDTDSWCL